MKNSNRTSYREFAKEVLQAIKEEPFFNDEDLIPKIMTLAKMFQLNISSNNYKNIESPTEYQKRLRQLECVQYEKDFWQREFKEKCGESEFKNSCQKLDDIKIKYLK
jgi:hypothetical protein